MKLFNIWNASESWKALANASKPPTLAYRLMKYSRKYQIEFEICEKQRVTLVRELANVGPSEVGFIGEGTPEMVELRKRFNEFLQSDSDLEPVGISMEEMVTGLHDDAVITEIDLALLEPFFEKRSPTLELVKNEA